MKANWMKQFQILACLLTFNYSALSQTYSWHQKSSFTGSQRWGAFAFELNGYGYVGGGYLGNVNLNDVWKYDPSSDSWTQVSTCPLATRASGSFALNNYGYYVGGIVQSGAISDQLYQYNPILNTWITKAQFPTSGIYGGTSFSINNKGYYGIGNAGSALGPYLTTFYQYDPATDQWTQKATFPGAARYGSYGIASSSFGYSGFGTDENSGLQFNDWWQYNPSTNSWQQKLSYPGVARTYPAGFYINGKIYLGIGQTLTSVLDDFNSYDETSNTWTSEQSFPNGGRWVASSFAINDNGYISAGGDFGGNPAYNDLWEFSPDSLTSDSIICVTIKPDATKGKDAHVLSGLPALNVEPHQEMLAVSWTCMGNPCVDRELIQFDLNAIPKNAMLISGSLSLYAHPNPVTIPYPNSGNANACYIQRIITSWDENTVTWNTQPATTTINQVILPQSISQTQSYINFDVTQLVQDMLNDPTNSYGFMIRLIDESTSYNGRDFASSDYPDSTVWPRITLCYKLQISSDTIKNSFINILPNPFSDNLQIVVLLTEDSPVSIEIYNNLGQAVCSKSYMQKANEWIVNKFDIMNNSTLARGEYYVRVTSNAKSLTEKIIKL